MSVLRRGGVAVYDIAVSWMDGSRIVAGTVDVRHFGNESSRVEKESLGT